MNISQGLQSLLLPLSIRNTLKRHRLAVADVFSFEKVAGVLTDRSIADLITVQQTIYRLLPVDLKEHILTGHRPGYQLPNDLLNWNARNEGSDVQECYVGGCSPFYGDFGFMDLAWYYENQNVSPALKERFQKSIKPLLGLLCAKSEYALFVERMFQKKSEQEGSVVFEAPIAFGDWDPDKAFDIQLTDANQLIVIYDEKRFPSAQQFQQLVSDLLNMSFKLSNYEETVQRMGDLFTYYLNRLEMK